MPLPRSPLKWEAAQARNERVKVAEAVEHFEVRDTTWKIVDIEKIPPSERPDTAFRQLHPSNSGLLMVDDLGNAEGLGPIEAAVLRYDRGGKLAGKTGLRHGIYRIGVHPLGHGFDRYVQGLCLACLRRTSGKPILETTFQGVPEIVALRKRFEISDGQLKNHIRSVALSQDASRYLFTAVDAGLEVLGSAGIDFGELNCRLRKVRSQIATPSNNFGIKRRSKSCAFIDEIVSSGYVRGIEKVLPRTRKTMASGLESA